MTRRRVSRRVLLPLTGTVVGSGVPYQAMTERGYGGETGYPGPIRLEVHPRAPPAVGIKPNLTLDLTHCGAAQ